MTQAHDRVIQALDGMMPQTAIILGSGLGSLSQKISRPVRISYGELEGFPPSGVSGHSGELIAGYLENVPVIMLSGRVHYYEHGDAAAMRQPLDLLRAVGIRRLVATNSAGSVREDMPPGSVMMITDHINWSGRNPLIGVAGDERFVGMTNAYDITMAQSFRGVAAQLETPLFEGVYMWFSGPSFETPAEIRAARLLGADAVGMSTVPEIILARYLGLQCAAFSVITNFGAGMTGDELSHDETKEMAPRGGAVLAQLIGAAIGELDQ